MHLKPFLNRLTLLILQDLSICHNVSAFRICVANNSRHANRLVSLDRAVDILNVGIQQLMQRHNMLTGKLLISTSWAANEVYIVIIWRILMHIYIPAGKIFQLISILWQPIVMHSLQSMQKVIVPIIRIMDIIRRVTFGMSAHVYFYSQQLCTTNL